MPDEARVEGLTITRNGQLVDPIGWNRDLPVDGGTYVIAGKAPGFEAWSTKVTVANARDKQSVNVPRFRAIGEAPSTGTLDAGAVDTERRPGGRSRSPAVAMWAVGGLAVTGGVAMELVARSTHDDARASMINQERHDLTSAATRYRRIGVALDVAGLVAIAGGAYFWRRAGHRPVAVTAAVTADQAQLVISGIY